VLHGEALLETAGEWRALGRARRREVIEMAKRGEVHYDPTVADIAYRWARARIGWGQVSPRGKSAVTWALIVIMYNLGPRGAGKAQWSERLAERIVTATDAARSAS
jgi:hypothetical protein